MSERENLKIHEAREKAELAHENRSLGPVSLTMAVLAVLAAGISTLGHRAHNEVLLSQTRANFQKAELVGKETQRHADAVLLEFVAAISAENAASTALRNELSQEMKLYGNERDLVTAAERDLEIEREQAKLKANRLDMGELLCEMALVLASITLLTRQRTYWFAGILAGVAGLVIAISGFWFS